jgi:hypothetical protein
MAEAMGPQETVTRQEMVPAQMFEREALRNVLESKRGIQEAEGLQDVKRLRERALKGRWRRSDDEAQILGTRKIPDAHQGLRERPREEMLGQEWLFRMER